MANVNLQTDETFNDIEAKNSGGRTVAKFAYWCDAIVFAEVMTQHDLGWAVITLSKPGFEVMRFENGERVEG